MQPWDDSALLRQFADNQSDTAFAGLVARHINLVYSVALRQVGNPHHAEEITQAVFIILARKAARLHTAKCVSSWLFQTTRLTANNFKRSEVRRQQREQEAYMQSVMNESGNDVWPRIAPLLDDAVASLREKDRQAIMLRFYEGRDLREVGLALGANEAAAEKRVSRAVEKLRKLFTKRGVTLSAVAIAGAVSANSVQAAPVGLAITVAATAAKGSAVAASTLTLIKGALKIMAWTKAKTASVVVIGILITAGTTNLVLQHFARRIYIVEMTTHSPTNPQWGLKVGTALLGWSQRDNSPEMRDGYIMMRNMSPTGHNEPLWEFALSSKRRLRDVARADLRCEFYGMNDPRGPAKFGDDWFGAGIRVSEGQVFFTRLISNRSTVYIIRLAKQSGNQDKATMQIEYMTETGFPP